MALDPKTPDRPVASLSGRQKAGYAVVSAFVGAVGGFVGGQITALTTKPADGRAPIAATTFDQPVTMNAGLTQDGRVFVPNASPEVAVSQDGSPRTDPSIRGRAYSYQNDSAQRTDYQYSGDTLAMNVVGSGSETARGRASFGHITRMIKQNLGSSAAKQGEIDGDHIFIRQGGPNPTKLGEGSDFNGLNISAFQVGEPGYGAGGEIAVGRIDPAGSGTVTDEVLVQLGIIGDWDGVPFSGPPNNHTYGMQLSCDKGRCFKGINVGPGSSGASWQTFLNFNNLQGPQLTVDGAMNIIQSNDGYSDATVNVPYDSITLRNKSGTEEILGTTGTVLASFAQNGTVGVPGKLLMGPPNAPSVPMGGSYVLSRGGAGLVTVSNSVDNNNCLFLVGNDNVVLVSQSDAAKASCSATVSGGKLSLSLRWGRLHPDQQFGEKHGSVHRANAQPKRELGGGLSQAPP